MFVGVCSPSRDKRHSSNSWEIHSRYFSMDKKTKTKTKKNYIVRACHNRISEFFSSISERDLYSLAKIVDSISISGSSTFTKIKGITGTPLLLACGILRHKCSYLDLTNSTLEFDVIGGRILSGVCRIFFSLFHVIE